MPHSRLLILLVAVLAAFAVPAVAEASFQSRILPSNRVSITGTDDAESLVIKMNAQNQLTHDQTSAGFASPLDWDTAAPGVQTVSSPAGHRATIVFNGEGGDDKLDVNPATPFLVADGGEGDDTIVGTPNHDVIQGAIGDDYVDGRGGDDDLYLGTGDDVAWWDAAIGGDDTVDGGDGNDVVSTRGTSAPDVLNVSSYTTGTDVTLANNRTRISAVERLAAELGLGNDLVEPEAVPASLQLTLDGGAGDDTLVGGAGPDKLSGGTGVDFVLGGPGDDGLSGEDINAGAGNDRMILTAGDDTTLLAEGEEGYDIASMVATSGDDSLKLSPQSPYVRVDGMAGGQPFIAGVISESLFLETGSGNDSATVQPGVGTLSALTVSGGPGGDVLRGSDGLEWLFGGSSDDVVDGGPAPDRLDGGAGADVIRARDRAEDGVSCANGDDIVVADLGELDRLLDGSACEHVDGAAATGAAALARVAANATLELRDHAIRVPVSCSDGARGGCQGTLSLVTADGVQISGTKLPALIGTRTVALAPGTTADVTVPVEDVDGLLRAAGGFQVQVMAQVLTAVAEHTTELSLNILR